MLHWILSFPVSATLYCPSGFSQYIIPKAFKEEGALLALISFLTPSCTESPSLKINPASSGGLWAFACWWKNVVQLGLKSVQFLALEIPFLAQPPAPLQHCWSPLPLLQTAAQGGYDKTPSAGRVRVKPGMFMTASAFREQGPQPLSSDMRPWALLSLLCLLHWINPHPGHLLQHFADVFIDLLRDSLYCCAAAAPVTKADATDVSFTLSANVRWIFSLKIFPVLKFPFLLCLQRIVPG